MEGRRYRDYSSPLVETGSAGGGRRYLQHSGAKGESDLKWLVKCLQFIKGSVRESGADYDVPLELRQVMETVPQRSRPTKQGLQNG